MSMVDRSSNSAAALGESPCRWKVVGITLVLEVVYGVILALILLAAVPSERKIIGGLIIVSVALFESLRSRRDETSTSI